MTIFASLISKFEIMKAQIITILLGFSLGVSAQEAYINEVMTQDDATSETWEETYEQLCELSQHPLDINSATREELEALPFLTSQQVEELMEYRDRYGAMKSLGELLMIRSLDYTQRRLLSRFVYVGEEKERGFPTLGEMAKYGHHELMATARIPFYERKGDQDGYLGYPYRHWMRYQFTDGDYLKLGLVGAQDAGEPFFANRNKWGYDYYSLYLQVRHLGRVESLCLGNYRVSMGMGLVMNSDFALGKVAMLQNMGRSASGIRSHSSRSNTSLLGVAGTFNLGSGLHLTAFASYRPVDATLNKDSTVSTILTTSYHRTESEMAKKNNLHLLKTGGSLRYVRHGIHLGLNALYVHLDKMLKPNTSILYRQHYPQGDEFLNTSLDYGFANPRLSFNGETALDKDGHLATINSASLRVGDALSIMALQRFYSYSYTSLDAQSYSDGGKVQNESGVYLGLSWQPSPKLRLVAYADYAYFAWARYQVSQSSHSWDYLLQATWQPNCWTLSARYRWRWRQKDNDDKTALVDRIAHRARLSAEYVGEGGFGCRTQFDGGYGEHEWGMMLSESLSYTCCWLRLNAGGGYFHTDSYDSRIYLYELAPLYTYAMSSFYGEGIRYWLMARVQIGSNLMLTAKAGVTNYFDRSTIGSSYQQIAASSQTDLDVQLRWKF